LTPAQSRRAPRIAAEIARRLLAAGRADEAMAALHEGTPKERQQADDDDGLAFYSLSGDYEWDEAYIDALLATDRKEEAQKVRWAGFERDLSAERLRAYLKTLPDFEDVIAEDKAMDYALRFRNATSALNFFIEWPNPCHAEKLVLARHAEIDGNAYYLLDPAARLLEGARPLAATVLRRAMIDDTLDGAKSGRYRHAARHLLECQSLDRDIKDYGSFETHAAFVTRIRAKHSRKTGFWARVSELSGMRTA
jgi:hypothetical protein